jgi:hypothetical protein
MYNIYIEIEVYLSSISKQPHNFGIINHYHVFIGHFGIAQAIAQAIAIATKSLALWPRESPGRPGAKTLAKRPTCHVWNVYKW